MSYLKGLYLEVPQKQGDLCFGSFPFLTESHLDPQNSVADTVMLLPLHDGTSEVAR